MILSASRRKQKNLGIKHWIALGLFAFIYPVFVSMYNFFPIFFGLCSYLFVLAVKKHNIPLMIICAIYSISLEINFSMPILNIIISALIFYVLIYNRLKLWISCKPCIAAISVVSIYVIYFLTLFIDDIIFFKTNHLVNFDWFLLFNLFVDIFLVVML